MKIGQSLQYREVLTLLFQLSNMEQVDDFEKELVKLKHCAEQVIAALEDDGESSDDSGAEDSSSASSKSSSSSSSIQGILQHEVIRDVLDNEWGFWLLPTGRGNYHLSIVSFVAGRPQ